MDKILVPMEMGGGTNNNIQVTNDGATILKSVWLDNPSAKILVDISKTQDVEVGDGTTTVAVLCGELLREAEKLVNNKIHPQVIIEGFRIAHEECMKVLKSIYREHKVHDDAFRHDLLNISRTTLSSKLLTQQKEYFTKLTVDAVLRLKGSTNLQMIKIIKKIGGSLKDS